MESKSPLSPKIYSPFDFGVFFSDPKTRGRTAFVPGGG
jgi:hypothetical protein